MTSIAPTSPRRHELRIRLVDDLDAAFDGDLAAVRAALQERLARGRQDIVRGEELAQALLAEAWDALEPAVAAALDAVEEEYAAAPARLAEARAELLAGGRQSWVARALCARIAFDLAYDALGDIGALAEL